VTVAGARAVLSEAVQNAADPMVRRA